MSLLRFTGLICVLILTAVPYAAAVEQWRGSLTVSLDQDKVRPGQDITLSLDAIRRNRSQPDSVRNRDAAIWLVPQRFVLLAQQSIAVQPQRVDETTLSIPIPNDLPGGWYEVVVVMADDYGRLPGLAEALNDRDWSDQIQRQMIAVANPGSGPQLYLHTERQRQVFTPGEEIRFMVSGRQRGGLNADVVLALYPREAEGRPMPIAQGRVSAEGDQAATVIFDYPASASAAIADGDYYLALIHDRQPVDRLPVRFISGERASGGARWAHTHPYGSGSGFDSSPVIPERLQSSRFLGVIDDSLTRIHNANLWVHFFTNHHPLLGPKQDLPYQDDPDMPPPAAHHRPSLTHSFYQLLMAEGVSLGITLGYGEDYSSEAYMPIPTEIDEHINVMARKYINGSLGSAWLPNFVAVYTDYYGHVEYSGGRELSDEEREQIRQSVWESATAAAGIHGAEIPLNIEFGGDGGFEGDLNRHLRSNRSARHAYRDWRAEKKAFYDDDDDWFENNYTTREQQLAVWQEMLNVVEFEGYQEPPRRVPLPTMNSASQEEYGDQAAYDYAAYTLGGIQRAYGRFTRFIEEELPAVFTIHNRGTMNHSGVSHAWSGFRTPNIDPAYLEGGATVIAASEWNLDAMPKPYQLTTFYNRFLIDRGHPVYRQGLWRPMGSPARFMRDAVFWAGRQVQTFFDQPGNMSWSHRGADQTTYASNERMASVTEFLSWYSDLIPRLEPVREVGLYVPAMGGPWGTGVTRGHYVAMISSLMSDHQVHMVSHGDIHDDRLGIYPIIYAPSIHGQGRLFPVEEEGIRKYLSEGGQLVVSQAPNYYHPPEVYSQYGIEMEEVPQLDGDGNPRTRRDGSVRTRREWTETPEQWAQVTKKWVWEHFDQSRVHGAPINVHDNFSHLDEDGNPAKWEGSHWTGHQNWAGYRGASLYQYERLKQVYDQLAEPIIVKDQPEVFVNVNTPKDTNAQGLWIFASNWTVPTHPDMMDKRLVQGHFNSAVKPVRAQLGLRSDGIGAIYDVISANQVPIEERDGRLYFSADLDGVEGRIYAALPEPIAGIQVRVPEQLASGQRFHPRLRYQGESGAELSIMGNVQITVRDQFGQQISQQRRSVPATGMLPAVQVPAGISSLELEIIDTIAGNVATVEIPVEMTGLHRVGPQDDQVTTYRADRMHSWLSSVREAGSEVVVLVDSGVLKFDDGAVTVETENPHADHLQRWAEGVAGSLRNAGLQARVARSEDVVTERLHAHPWTGRMASYRARHSVPSYRIDAPVIVVGSPRTSPIIDAMERSMVLQRSAQVDAVSGSRGLIAWNPRSFAPDQHALVVALDDDAALPAVQERLQGLVSQPQAVDSYYQAREWTRFTWTPSEVQIHKRDRGLFAAEEAANDQQAQQEVASNQRWQGLGDTVGTAIFDLRASPGGVAVGTKSWVRPTGAISPDGDILGFWGGDDEITPRDVAIAADGKHVAAGYALLGRSVIYEAGGERKAKHRSGIVHSANMFRWDSFKESDRHIGANPQGTQFLLVSGDALIAYDALSAEEQWRIPMVAPLARQQGQPQPEIAYSPDGNFVMAQPRLQDAEPLDVEIVVERWVQRADGSWDSDETTEQRVQLRCLVHRHELWLIDARSGEPKWRRLINKKLIDQETGRLVWRTGGDIEYEQEIDGSWRKWEAADEHELPYVGGRPVEEPTLLRVPFWHLYSTVGPEGEWSIAGAREPRFSLLDDEGKILRSWEERSLPDELQAGDEIPVHIVPSRDPRRILAFAPQRRHFIVYDLIIGDAATRRRAQELEAEHDRILQTIRDEIRNRRNYRNYGNDEYLEAFAERISGVPEDLRDNLISRMRRVPAERRAGRRRDHRFFSSQVEDIAERLFQIGEPVFDAAAGIEEVTRLSVDALINDAAVDERLQVVYASLWDGTVRALEVSTGNELWRTEIVGGARMDLVLDDNGQISALYAGGSRGDLYRLNPEDGSIIWHRNITEATNSFDP